MIAYYLKIALRNLFKHKGFSFISIVGLAVSISVCLLIIVFVKHQLSYDRAHKNSARIYHIYSDYKAAINTSSQLYATSPASLGQILQAELPGVENFITLNFFDGQVQDGENQVDLHGFYTSDAFFEILNFKLLSGNPTTALQQPNTIVLTEATAERLFGEKDPVGATISIIEQGEFLVTGVVAKANQPTVFEFEALVSLATLQSDKKSTNQLQPWDKTVRQFYNFVLLKKGAQIENITMQLHEIINRHFPGDQGSYLVALHMQTLTSIAMGQIMDNQIKFILPPVVLYILSGLALIILIAACFNYVSLSVARALNRAREVGVRKVVGAHRRQILIQFLVEAICVSMFALLIAQLFLVFLVDGFNNLTPIQVTQAQITPDFGDINLYLLFMVFSLVVGVLSGLYPAFYLSGFLPTVVLKGIGKIKGRGYTIRKMLIVIQFSLSLLFIISTLLLYQQSQHVRRTDYGFNEKNIINVKLGELPYEILRSELLQYPGIKNVSAVSILTGEGGRNDTWMKSDEIIEPEKGYSLWIDEHFIDNLEIPLVAGQGFKENHSKEVESFVLLNETAVSRLQLGAPVDAIGKNITIDDNVNVQVIGIVKDFRFFSALAAIDPLVLRLNSSNLSHVNIRFEPNDFAGVEAHLQTTWKKINPAEPLVFKLYEDYLGNALELRVLKDFMHIIGLAATFAILIACLGLLGMACNMVQTRLREIGLRKVLGATMTEIILVLSKSFVKLIILSVLIAGPLTWFVNKQWLQLLGNRIELAPPVFILGVALLLVIALLTIGSQTVRAAFTNPTEILKNE